MARDVGGRQDGVLGLDHAAFAGDEKGTERMVAMLSRELRQLDGTAEAGSSSASVMTSMMLAFSSPRTRVVRTSDDD